MLPWWTQNLYQNGKVCLSLLGTWNGEPWDPAHSNLSQLLLSILAFIFTTEPLRNEPGLESSHEKSVNFFNAYIRLETLETAMLNMLAKPPTEFTDVIRRHFKQAWATQIRPDLVQWGQKHNPEDSESSTHCNGQIMRMTWFKQALGAGNYAKMMTKLIARMDEAVAGIKEFDAPAEAEALRGGARAAGESSRSRGGGGEGGGSSQSGAGGPAAASSSGSSSSSSGSSSGSSSS